MPLHDWDETEGWEGVHIFWITELARSLKKRLPAGFRAYLRGGPAVEPNAEMAVRGPETSPALYVERAGRLVAAVELVSPRNKDRPEARTNYLNRYAGYLTGSVNLLPVDVHPRPAGFSFADGIARALKIPNQPALPPPTAVSYRLGEPATDGGRFLAIWEMPLRVGAVLPALPLPHSRGARSKRARRSQG